MKEKNLELNHLKKMLHSMESMGADLAAIGDLKLIYVAFASMPIKNCEAFQTAITGLPLFVKQSHLTEEECFLCVAAPSKAPRRSRNASCELIMLKCSRCPMTCPTTWGSA